MLGCGGGLRVSDSIQGCGSYIVYRVAGLIQYRAESLVIQTEQYPPKHVQIRFDAESTADTAESPRSSLRSVGLL